MRTPRRPANQYTSRGLGPPDGRRVPPPLISDEPDAEQVAWAFLPHGAEWITEAELSTHSEAQPWIDADFSPREAGIWIRGGFPEPAAAAGWHELSFSPYTAAPWRDAGLSPDEYRIWSVSFRDPANALAWRAAGFAPREARRWYDRKVSPDVAIEWASSGFPDDPRHSGLVVELISDGCTAAEAVEWLDSGFFGEGPEHKVSVFGIRNWRQAFGSFEASRPFLEAGRHLSECRVYGLRR